MRSATRCIRSRARGEFQLPLYRGKPYPPVTFDQPGVVTLGCNIHDNMLAYIVVTAAPCFGRTDASGEWTVPNLPRGKYSAAGLASAAQRAAGSRTRRRRRRRARRRRDSPRARPASRTARPDVRTHGTTDSQHALSGCARAWSARRRRPADWELALDLRAVSSDGRESFLDNGQGKLRFDEDHQGIQLGRLRAAWNQPLGEVFSAHVEASTWDDDDKNPIDLTEAYLEYRPYPRAGLRTRLRLGAFYPPMSLESRAVGWETPYTITPSAISSWIGEEIRTVGLEGQVDWLGTRLGHSLRPATHRRRVRLERSGRHDARRPRLRAARPPDHVVRPRRRAADRSRIRRRKNCSTRSTTGRGTTSARRRATSIARCSTSCTTTIAPIPPSKCLRVRDFAWLTKFDAAALRIETGNGWTAILQALDGDTYIAPGGFWLDWEFDSQSALLAKRVGAHMLAVRYDAFERGVHAATPPHPAAKTATPGRWRIPSIAASTGASRSNGCASRATCRRAWSCSANRHSPRESKLEFSARYLLSGSF